MEHIHMSTYLFIKLHRKFANYYIFILYDGNLNI